MTLKTDSKKYEYEIDTKTGEVLSNSVKAINKKDGAHNAKQDGSLVQDSYIGEEKALETAIAHSALAEADLTHKKAKLDNDDGIVVYEITLKTLTEKYEYEIDAKTGEIIESEHKTVKKQKRQITKMRAAHFGELFLQIAVLIYFPILSLMINRF